MNSSAQPVASNLLQMELKADRSEYPVGALPHFTVTLRNAGSQPLRLCVYKLDYRLKAAMIAENQGEGADYELQPFHPVGWDALQESDVISLAPGQEFKHELKLEKDPLFGFVRRHSQPPVLARSMVIPGFPVGKYRFNTAISQQVGLYVGKDGVFDHNLQARMVPRDLPGGQAYPDTFTDLVEASAYVSFH